MTDKNGQTAEVTPPLDKEPKTYPPGQRTSEQLLKALHDALDDLFLYRPMERVALMLLRSFTEIPNEDVARVEDDENDGCAIREQWIHDLGNVVVEAARE